MDATPPLESLRRRVGIVEARSRVEASGAIGATILPAVNVVLTLPGETHGLHTTAALLGLAPFYFSRLFKHVLGMGFHEFVDRVRVDAALVALADTDAPTGTIAARFGFLGVPTLDLSLAEYTGLPLMAVLAFLRP